jgi:hypothetical protein
MLIGMIVSPTLRIAPKDGIPPKVRLFGFWFIVFTKCIDTLD